MHAFSSLAVSQELIKPGQESEIFITDCEYSTLIYVPSDYKSGVRLPLIIFLHGAGGSPTSWPFRSATGGNGYFIAGLSYEPFAEGGRGRNGILSDKNSCLAMIKHINKVRAYVHKTYGIDQKTVILSGLSMGGWGVSFYGINKESDGLYRAYCIIAAGPNNRSPIFEPEVTKGLPVLLLNGETDANLAAANNGRPLLEDAGAIVTQVIIPGEGHVPSTQSMAPHLKDWLDKIREEDKRVAPIPGVRWKFGKLVGSPKKGADKDAVLLDYLKGQKFLDDADEEAPTMIYFHSVQEDKKGKPTRCAKDSASIELKLFSFPDAVQVPAASANFNCFKVDASSITKKDNSLINQTMAPIVILLNKDLSVTLVLKKSKLKDSLLSTEMKKLLSEEEAIEIDQRAEEIKPLLKDLEKLLKKMVTQKESLAKLKRKGVKQSSNKLKQMEETFSELEKEYNNLKDRLLSR